MKTTPFNYNPGDEEPHEVTIEIKTPNGNRIVTEIFENKEQARYFVYSNRHRLIREIDISRLV